MLADCAMSRWRPPKPTVSTAPSIRPTTTSWAPPAQRHHAGRVRQLRLPVLPRRERGDREAARPLRRSHALRLPAAADHRQRHRAPRRRHRGVGAATTRVLGRARQAHDALGDADRGRPRERSPANSASTRTPAEAPGRARVEADIASARASGVRVTPTFFINGRRYDGPWDEVSLSEAMLGSLGHRVQSAAVDFASWAPSTGVLLLADVGHRGRARQFAARARVRRVLGSAARLRVRRTRAFACRSRIG